MRVRICDGCDVILRGRYSKVIPFGVRPTKTMDLCPKCLDMLSLNPPAKNPGPRLRRFYDAPLDGSPIKVLNQGDYPPNSSPK